MARLNRKQRMIISILGTVLALALAVTLTVVVIDNRPSKQIFVKSNAIVVTLEGNIGVQLSLNPDFAVTDTAVINGSQEYVKNLSGGDFRTSFIKLIDTLIQNNQITGAKDEVLLLTIECIKETDYTKAVKTVNDILNTKNIQSNVIKLYIRFHESRVEAFAQKHKISYGKAYFCQKVADKSKNLNADELAGKTIKEIYRLATNDKSESHISSLVSSLNSSQVAVKPPNDQTSSKPSSTSSKPSSNNTSSSSSVPSPNTSVSSFTSDTDDGFISNWY